MSVEKDLRDGQKNFEEYHDQAAKVYSPPRPRISVAEIDGKALMLQDALEAFEAMKDNTPEHRTGTIQLGRTTRHKEGYGTLTPYDELQCEMLDVLKKYLEVRIRSLRHWFDDRGIDPGVD